MACSLRDKRLQSVLVVMIWLFFLVIAIPWHLVSTKQQLVPDITDHIISSKDSLSYDEGEWNFSSTSINVQKRVTDSEYERSAAKGCGRLRMLSTGNNIPPTQAQEYSQLIPDWFVDFSMIEGIPEDLRKPYTDLKYDDLAADNPNFTARRSATNIFDGHYEFIINLYNGVIVALASYSPARAGSGRAMPAISALSDVVWLVWQDYVSRQPLPQPLPQPQGLISNINTIIRHHIINDQTEEVMDQVLQNLGADYGPWPGITVRSMPGSLDLEALVGTVHGSMPVFLLAQHRSIIGAKTITEAQIFTNEEEDAVNIAFHVGNL